MFLSTDLFWFYYFFESLMLPFFFIINIFGYRKRKNIAAYLFLFYTVLGSIFLLIGIFYIFHLTGTTDFRLLNNLTMTWSNQLILWCIFFIGLSIKIPVFPFHIWLPEAHVEAPTLGSVILASLVLKISVYGILRILTLFQVIWVYMEPIIICIAFSSFMWSAIICLRQIDLKKLIAYSSIVHMNFALLGLMLCTSSSILGSLISSISHGLVSSALFFCSGMLYDRFNTRNLFYYGGLTKIMPLMAIFFFLFSLGNCGFPGSIGFIGEFLILFGSTTRPFIVLVIFSIILIFTTIYSIWLYDKIFNGPLVNYNVFYDLTKIEFNILLTLCVLIIFFGLNPNLFIEVLTPYAQTISLIQ